MIEHSPSIDDSAQRAASHSETDGDVPTQSGDIVLTPAADPVPDAEARPAGDGAELSPPATESVASQLDAVRDLLARHAQRLDELVRIGERREDVIDHLHDENQRLRAGEIARVQEPLIRELIRTHDLVLQLLGDSGDQDLERVRGRLMDAIELAGVRVLEVGAGDAFDHKYHLAVEAISTALEEEHMTVAATGRPGFIRFGGEVVRPADVRVRTYTPKSARRVDESHDHAEPGAGR